MTIFLLSNILAKNLLSNELEEDQEVKRKGEFRCN